MNPASLNGASQGGAPAPVVGASEPAVAQPSNSASPQRSPGNRGSDAQNVSRADQIVKLVQSSAALFHDAQGVGYAEVRVKGRKDVFRLRSKQMKTWMAATVLKRLGCTATERTLDQVLTTLDGIASFDCPMHPASVRVVQHSSTIYLDLGDETGDVVEITADGWKITRTAPVKFRRPDSLRALPRPERGGSLDDLRPFLNLPDEDSFHMLVAWLVSAFRPGLPVPVLALHGEQGTAKSTTTRVARALVDPHAAAVRAAPRKEDDLIVASQHSHVIAYDNISGIRAWLADALCRLVTGGGISKRTLYSDGDETVIEAIRPIIVNGIDDVAERADFAERCIVLELKPIAKGERRDEQTFWVDFDMAAPRILGVLLDGVSAALRNLPSVELRELPRMADFAKWITAAEPGLGLASGTLCRAYARNRQASINAALDASPVATAVRGLLDEPRFGGGWEGTPEKLLETLNLKMPTARALPAWPKSPTALSKALRRNATFLRSVGVTLDLDGHQGRGDGKRRFWRLAKQSETSSQGSVPIDHASPDALNPNADTGSGAGTMPRAESTPAPNVEKSYGGLGDGGDAMVLGSSDATATGMRPHGGARHGVATGAQDGH